MFVADDEALAVSSGTDFTWDFISCDEIDDDGIRLSMLGDRNVYFSLDIDHYLRRVEVGGDLTIFS